LIAVVVLAGWQERSKTVFLDAPACYCDPQSAKGLGLGFVGTIADGKQLDFRKDAAEIELGKADEIG